MKKLILLLFVLLSFNIYSAENSTQITTTHPVICARIKVKANKGNMYFLRYDKISDIKYKIIDGEPTIFISYNGSVFDIIEIKGEELCNQFIKELEDFNRYLKSPIIAVR